MNKVKIEKKPAFRLIGFRTVLQGGTSIHAPQYSNQKTTFFKSQIENGRLAGIRPLAEGPYGYAAVALEDGSVRYYAGVSSTKPLPAGADELHFPEGEYVVLSGQGGLSRLAFDRLEDQALGSLFTDAFEYEYNGGPIAEVLLNGNPMDAEVEVWVPVRKK
ncbi:effector binding domain-containing protein [Cohnella hashimotonis]|uniref:Effector binding domain-containing protein n=1 Tax=Cohnella hashimotonis TaxID=2826895 RepID=A0ABT6TNZ5_9BACL|nr:effector binding domain-containing protein [Cohnella hashimotonis]MDI4647948.1 effector binding domain-containing protein [Cohnella hashimotonis]